MACISTLFAAILAPVIVIDDSAEDNDDFSYVLSMEYFTSLLVSCSFPDLTSSLVSVFSFKLVFISVVVLYFLPFSSDVLTVVITSSFALFATNEILPFCKLKPVALFIFLFTRELNNSLASAAFVSTFWSCTPAKTAASPLPEASCLTLIWRPYALTESAAKILPLISIVPEEFLIRLL